MQARTHYLLCALVLVVVSFTTPAASSRVQPSSLSGIQLSKPSTAFAELRRLAASKLEQAPLGDKVQNFFNGITSKVLSSGRSSSVRSSRDHNTVVSSGAAHVREDTVCGDASSSIADTCTDPECTSFFASMALSNDAWGMTGAQLKSLYCTKDGENYCLDRLDGGNVRAEVYCGVCGTMATTLAELQGAGIEDQLGMALNEICMKDPADGKYCMDKLSTVMAPLVAGGSDVDVSDAAALEPQLQVLCSSCGRMVLSVISNLFENGGSGNGAGNDMPDVPEDLGNLFASLSDLICLKDSDGTFCYTSPEVSSWGEKYLAGESNMESDPVLAEEGAAAFCDHNCLTLMIPAMAALDTTLESFQSIYTAGCYQDGGLYCLAKFARNRAAFELSPCDGSSSCSAACQDAVDDATVGMGCCLAEAIALAPDGDMTAAKACASLPDRCESGGETKMSITIANLRHSWFKDNWQTQSVKEALEMDVGRSLHQASEMVHVDGVSAGGGGGSVVAVEVAVQSAKQAEVVMNRIQGISRRRADVTIELSSLSSQVPSTAFVDPAQPLSATVDASTIKASGAASQFVVEESAAGRSMGGGGIGVWGMLALACVLSGLLRAV